MGRRDCFTLAKASLKKEKRAMQDSNPRPRLRRPEGYPDYPNCPIFMRTILPFEDRARLGLGEGDEFSVF